MSLPDSLMPKEEIGRRPWSRFRTTDYLNNEHRATSPSEDVIFGTEPDVGHRCSMAKFIYTMHAAFLKTRFSTLTFSRKLGIRFSSQCASAEAILHAASYSVKQCINDRHRAKLMSKKGSGSCLPPSLPMILNQSPASSSGTSSPALRRRISTISWSSPSQQTSRVRSAPQEPVPRSSHS